MAPVQTILPDENIKAVVRGSRIRMITAANRLGLYSALRALSAIDLSSSLQPRFTVHTMFLKENVHLSSLKIWIAENKKNYKLY